MESSSKPHDELLVAIRKRCALVKVIGRGTFKAGPSLKRFCTSALAKGCTQIIIDMGECVGMDSTFMGVMAGLALRMQREASGQLVAMNLTPKTSALLSTLGLDQLVTCYQADGELPQAFKTCLVNNLDLEDLDLEGDEKKVSLEVMLEAHQHLVEASPQNITRFRDVITYLDQDLKDFDH